MQPEGRDGAQGSPPLWVTSRASGAAVKTGLVLETCLYCLIA